MYVDSFMKSLWIVMLFSPCNRITYKTAFQECGNILRTYEPCLLNHQYRTELSSNQPNQLSCKHQDKLSIPMDHFSSPWSFHLGVHRLDKERFVGILHSWELLDQQDLSELLEEQPALASLVITALELARTGPSEFAADSLLARLEHIATVVTSLFLKLIIIVILFFNTILNYL